MECPLSTEDPRREVDIRLHIGEPIALMMLLWTSILLLHRVEQRSICYYLSLHEIVIVIVINM